MNVGVKLYAFLSNLTVTGRVLMKVQRKNDSAGSTAVSQYNPTGRPRSMVMDTN
jgi:hypothetical protein